LTWIDYGPRWNGIAGMVSVCKDDNDNYYFGGYYKPVNKTAWSVIGKFDIDTGQIENISLIFGKGYGFVGNGAIIYSDNRIQFVMGNYFTQTFGEFITKE
jgi:hypothetical protein